MYSTISGDAPSQFSSTSQNLLALQQEAKQKRKCRRAGVIIIIIIINFNFATFTYVSIFSLMLNYFVTNDFNHIKTIKLFNYQTILVMRALS